MICLFISKNMLVIFRYWLPNNVTTCKLFFAGTLGRFILCLLANKTTLQSSKTWQADQIKGNLRGNLVLNVPPIPNLFPEMDAHT